LSHLFGAGFFVYTLIWEGKPFWDAFFVMGFGLVFSIMAWVLRRKEKRAGKIEKAKQ